MIGLPASICCQCLAEKPKPIISSCVYPRDLRSFLILSPNARKNCLSSITSEFVRDGERKHHERISVILRMQEAPGYNQGWRNSGAVLGSTQHDREGLAGPVLNGKEALEIRDRYVEAS